MGEEPKFLNTENVQNLCIAICVISALMFLALLTTQLVTNSKVKSREHRIEKVEAIRACGKTTTPALCIAALKP